MIEAAIDPTFASWQERARTLLASGTAPDQILWSARGDEAFLPLYSTPSESSGPSTTSPRARVPKRFIELARLAVCHRAADRWSVLYRVLWRLTHEDRGLLERDADRDVVRLRWLVQQVRHDVHRMQAFVRFRRVADGRSEQMVGWYVPDHDVAALVAPHFAERYPKERWSIITPQASIHWRDGALTIAAGVPHSALPQQDTDGAAEDLWRVYYAAAFNPARLNERKLRRDLPARFWNALPEAASIPSLIAEAPGRAAELRTRSGGATNRASIPPTADIGVLREAANACRSCPLYEHATQTVFGEGPSGARLLFVGEQPGDVEDRTGRPFVGPAGAVLDRALAEAGIDRADVYVTNAVKHFAWEPRGKRRIHRTPRLSEMQACRPWLEHELASVKPYIVVLLGGVAARSLLGPQTRVSAVRGRVLSTPWAPALVVTFHPSAVLRASDQDAGDRTYSMLVADLRLAAACLEARSSRVG